MKVTKADILIHTSQCIKEKDVESVNKYKIEDNDVEYDKIPLSLKTSFDFPEEKIQKKFEQDAKLYTLVISGHEQNPLFGCPYFTLDWGTRKIENNSEIKCQDNCLYISDKVEIRDKLTINQTRSIKLHDLNKIYKDNYLESEYNNLLLDNYYNACVSDVPQTKFFYLFLIFECYEKNKNFINTFRDKLFSDEEINSVLQVVKNFKENVERKVNVIKELTNRTLKSRHEKFYEYLLNRNINAIKKYCITSDDINDIIIQRNKLFHTSSKFNLEILFFKLFPMIQELLETDLFTKQNGL